jgi:hypothetical protein
MFAIGIPTTRLRMLTIVNLQVVGSGFGASDDVLTANEKVQI